eukprot:scaffold83389_cov27-Tisochrysis_lutea.AAC.1
MASMRGMTKRTNSLKSRMPFASASSLGSISTPSISPATVRRIEPRRLRSACLKASTARLRWSAWSMETASNKQSEEADATSCTRYSYSSSREASSRETSAFSADEKRSRTVMKEVRSIPTSHCKLSRSTRSSPGPKSRSSASRTEP